MSHNVAITLPVTILSVSGYAAPGGSVTSKERVRAALDRRPVDRVPIFMWFHPQTSRGLATLLEIPQEYVGEAMGNDIVQTWVNNNYAMEGIAHDREGEAHVDYWGIRWVNEGGFNQIDRAPLEHADRNDMLAYEFPRDHTDELLGNMEPILRHADAYFTGCDVSPCVFEMYWRLRGMEAAMMDLACDEPLAREMLGRAARFAAHLADAACDRFPLDWLWTGDDVAGQQGMMMSPALWRKLVRPELQLVFDVGRKHDLPIAYHCCGSLRPIIDDLVEMGLGVLNPVQSNCPGMDPYELKREYGRELAFMGGVDTQGLLPNATAAQVRRETEALIDGMTLDGGGFILAASHTVPPETPPENIFAMYEAAGLSREEIGDAAAGIRARLGGRLGARRDAQGGAP